VADLSRELDELVLELMDDHRNGTEQGPDGPKPNDEGNSQAG
jgi:hypothetical protein